MYIVYILSIFISLPEANAISRKIKRIVVFMIFYSILYF